MSVSDTVPFSLHVVGEVTGETWTGDFLFKNRLSMLDRLRLDNFFRLYIGESNPQFASPRVLEIAEVLAQLRVRITKAPDWWAVKNNGQDLEDMAPLKALYEVIADLEKKAEAKSKSKAQQAQDDLRSLGTLGDDEAKV
jgi:hypothetical protein